MPWRPAAPQRAGPRLRRWSVHLMREDPCGRLRAPKGQQPARVARPSHCLSPSGRSGRPSELLHLKARLHAARRGQALQTRFPSALRAPPSFRLLGCTRTVFQKGARPGPEELR